MKTEEYSPLALAYIGDARYALQVKKLVIDREVKMDRMQKHTNRYVSRRHHGADKKRCNAFLTAHIHTGDRQQPG